MANPVHLWASEALSGREGKKGAGKPRRDYKGVIALPAKTGQPTWVESVASEQEAAWTGNGSIESHTCQ